MIHFPRPRLNRLPAERRRRAAVLARGNQQPAWRMLHRYLLSYEPGSEVYYDWPVGEVIARGDADLTDPAEFAIARYRNPRAKAIAVRKSGVVALGATLRAEPRHVIAVHDRAWRTLLTPGLEHLASLPIRLRLVCLSATAAAREEAAQSDVEILIYRPRGWRSEGVVRLRPGLSTDDSGRSLAR